MFELAIAFDALPDIRRYAAALTTAELHSALEKLLGFTADNLLRMAVVVAELEGRGEDLSGLKLGILPILRDIAAGKLLPAVVVQFAGQPGLIRQIARRSLGDQELIAAGALPAPAPPRRLPAANVRGAGGLRSVFRPTVPGGDDQDEPGAPDVTGIASAGNPRDVGEMAAELVLKCPGRAAALSGLADRLVGAGAITADAAHMLKAPMAPPARRPFWIQE